MDTDGTSLGATNLAGSMTRQSSLNSAKAEGDEGHVSNVGRMIEDMEIEMRSNMDGLYLQKTSEVRTGERSRGLEGSHR